MLCDLAHNFPPKIAQFLERDRGLKRNFREESVTDMLMFSLVGLRPFGVSVDFPDEPTTGGDMEWVFAAPRDINGGRYLRIILQAKRAQFSNTKGGYWYYQHLDHEKGKQANTLVSHASGRPGGMSTPPLYIFYHPNSALSPKTASSLPAVDGVNLVFAHQVAPVVAGGCARKDKTVEAWRGSFMRLSDILCWPFVSVPPPPGPAGSIGFQIIGGPARRLPFTPSFHPDVVAARLQRRLETAGGKFPLPADLIRRVSAAEGIRDDLQRAIEGNVTLADRKELVRPRVIFTTQMSREHPSYVRAVRRGQSDTESRYGMHEQFRAFTEDLHPKFEALMAQEPVLTGILRPEFSGSGVYMFSEAGESLYVGRTRDVRKRYGQHTRRSSGHNSAPFAFKLARNATGRVKADYRPGENSRAGLLLDPEFAAAFSNALERIRGMEFRFVSEPDPTRQYLLEVYVSVVCGSPYNDFDTT